MAALLNGFRAATRFVLRVYVLNGIMQDYSFFKRESQTNRPANVEPA